MMRRRRYLAGNWTWAAGWWKRQGPQKASAYSSASRCGPCGKSTVAIGISSPIIQQEKRGQIISHHSVRKLCRSSSGRAKISAMVAVSSSSSDIRENLMSSVTSP
jgi:hypothetical protein